jgi:carbon-monoxide dehydrogenase large subunit
MNLRALTGTACYTADVAIDGALHVAFLRADHAHAEIVGIDTAEALAVPGVVAVLTGDDIAAPGKFRAFLAQPTADGRPLIVPDRPVLARDRVRHAGELVAMVVAETAAAAQDGVEAVMVDWAPLPVVAAGALDGADPIHPEAPDNHAARVDMGDADAVAAAFDAAARIVEAEVELPRVAPIPLEPRALLARWDGEAFDLWSAFQGGADLRRELCGVLDLPPEALRIHAAEVGGAFGARGAAYPEHVALLLAARHLRRPLRWQGTRSEMFLSEYPGRGMRLKGRLALDEDGRFTAVDIVASADLGAYVHPVGAHISVSNPVLGATGVYAIGAARMRVNLHFSNAVPLGPFRGAGRPDTALIVERLVDEAARATGQDPVALRRRNILQPSDFPYRTPLGAVYDSGDYGRMLDQAATLADLAGRPARVRAAQGAGRIPGIGIALFVEVAGGGAIPADEVALTVTMRGDAPHVIVETVSKDTGQGHEAAFAPLVAERLGLPAAAVSLVESVAGTTLEGGGSFGSRTSAAVGGAVVRGLDGLCDALVAAVADENGLPPEDLDCDAQAIRHKDGRVICPLGQALAAAAGRGLRVVGRNPVDRTYPSGCHIAEVEIDRDTGTLHMTRYVAVDDAGRVLSEPHLKAQILGGISQGIGNAVVECLVTDADGQMVNASLMDYALLRATDMPPVTVAAIACPSPTNALGVKGAGEAGTTGAIAAMGNAVANALAGQGVAPIAMPFSPGRLWSALHGRG